MSQFSAKSLLILISGPAGSGKTTLCDRMLKEFSWVKRVVTATTRKPRENEVDGVDYYFLTKSAFEEGIELGRFYEFARVHGCLYGVPKEEIQTKLMQGIDLLLNIDVQGAKTIRRVAAKDPLLKGRFVSVFIKPPDLNELKKRLSTRGNDTEEEISRRLSVAELEINEAKQYDYCIKSSSKDSDFKELCDILEKEKNRQKE